MIKNELKQEEFEEIFCDESLKKINILACLFLLSFQGMLLASINFDFNSQCIRIVTCTIISIILNLICFISLHRNDSRFRDAYFCSLIVLWIGSYYSPIDDISDQILLKSLIIIEVQLYFCFFVVLCKNFLRTLVLIIGYIRIFIGFGLQHIYTSKESIVGFIFFISSFIFLIILFQILKQNNKMREFKKIKEQLRYIELEKILNNDIQQGIMIITPKTTSSYLSLNDLKVKYVNNCFLNQFNVNRQEALHILPHIYASSIKHIDEGEKSTYLIKDSVLTRLNQEQDTNKESLKGQDYKLGQDYMKRMSQIKREDYELIQQSIIQNNSKILTQIVKNSQSLIKSSAQNRKNKGAKSYPKVDQMFNDVMNLAESTKIVQEEKVDSVHSLPPSIKINKKQMKEINYFTNINQQNNTSLNHTIQPENSQNVLLGLNKYNSDCSNSASTKINDKKNHDQQNKASIFKNQIFRKTNSQKIDSSPLQQDKNESKITFKQSSIKCEQGNESVTTSNNKYQINQKPNGTIIREGSNKNIHATTSRNIVDSNTKIRRSISQNQANPEGLVNLLGRINYYHQKYLQRKDKYHQFKNEKQMSMSQRNESNDQKYKQSLIIWEYKKEDKRPSTNERGVRQNYYNINVTHNDQDKKDNETQNNSQFKNNKNQRQFEVNKQSKFNNKQKKNKQNKDKQIKQIDTDHNNYLNLQQNHLEQEVTHLKMNEINSPVVDKEIIFSEDNYHQIQNNNNTNLFLNEYKLNNNRAPLLQTNPLNKKQILISSQNVQDNPESHDKMTQPNTITDRQSNKDFNNIQDKPLEQSNKNSFHQTKRKVSNSGLIAKQIDENILEITRDKRGNNGFMQGDERNKKMRQEDDEDDEDDDNSRQYLEIKLFECEMDKEESIMVIVNNINQRIKYERLKDMQTKNEQMLANVTHDLKTPLNCMTLMVEGMKLDKQYNEVTINMILENANLLMCLIQDILDYSQIKKGKLRLVQSYFQVSEIIQEVINLFQMQADQKNIKFISNIYRSSNSSTNVSLQNNANTQANMQQQTTQNTMNNCSFNTNGGSLNNFVQNRNKNNSIATFNETQSIPNINTLNHINEPIKNIQMHQDKNRIKQVLINLISNALKFTQEGHIEIRCDLKEMDEYSHIKIVEFSVRDTGVGMNPHIKSQLFKTFNTFDQKGLNKNGIGLGLTICKRLVTFLGPSDHFEVESEVSKGSTFSFQVFKDLRDIDNTHHTLTEESDESPDLGGKSLYNDIAKSITQNSKQLKLMKEEDQIDESQVVINNIPTSIARPNIQTFQEKFIESDNNSLLIQTPKCFEQNSFNMLIVDDQPFNIVAFKLILKNFQKISITEAYNGKEAFEKYQKQHFDCILMDYNMPIMNGYESTMLIRLYENQNNIPPCKIIIVSGFDERQKEFNKAMQGGADDYLTKPVNFKVLTEKLNSYMNVQE